MRIAISTLFLMSLMAGHALATGGGPPPGAGPRTKYGTLEVTNACDEAIRVSGKTECLEPNETVSYRLAVSGGTRDFTVNVSLCADPTVSASEPCTLQANKITRATVTCATTADAVSLMIECERPQQARLENRRDAAVALASGSGLGFLLLLGALLGRTPRHLRRKPVAEEASEPGDTAT